MPHSEHPCLEVCETFSKRTRRKDEVSRVTGARAESHDTDWDACLNNGRCVTRRIREMRGGEAGSQARGPESFILHDEELSNENCTEQS